MRQRLNKIYSPWKRLSITIAICTLSFISKFASTRARIHWIGGPRRPRRLERPIFPLIYLLGIAIFDGRDFAIWSMYAGGVASIFLILYTAYRFIPIKTAHWIGRKI